MNALLLVAVLAVAPQGQPAESANKSAPTSAKSFLKERSGNRAFAQIFAPIPCCRKMLAASSASFPTGATIRADEASVVLIPPA